jgi:putative RNA 2'-phosphotransferase
MDSKQKKRISKFLSYVLRHHPESIQLTLDQNGWANVDELIEKSTAKNLFFTKEEVHDIVATNDKKRFSFNEDTTMIRANQGHSLQYVDLEMKAKEPPVLLYHGTVQKYVASIQQEGLKKGNRQHVHLSVDVRTAENVGSRRGKPIVLEVEAQRMHSSGYEFFLSENGVWLTDHVPVEFIIF